MKRTIPCLVALVGLGAGSLPLLAPSPARATMAASLSLADETVDSRVSGYSGYVTNAGPSNDPGRGVFGITWSESSDDPWTMTAHTHHLNNDGVEADRRHEAPLRTHTPSGDTKEVLLSGRHDFIYKVQVCTTDKSDTSRNKLKGIRLWSRTVSDEGRLLTTNSSYQETKHTNCKKWHEKVECPTGTITSRLKLHYNADKTYTGIQLVCRKVRREG